VVSRVLFDDAGTALPPLPATSPCGDSTVATDVARVLGGVAPHLMVTDPPYGVNYVEGRRRDLAMFNLAIDSKLRGCDLVRLTIDDVVGGGTVRDRATVIQKKTGRPVQFEITEQTRSAIGEWLAKLDVGRGRYLFPSRFREQPHIFTRSMPVSSIGGWRAPVSIVRRTARTRCVARSRLRSTRRPVIGGCSYCWGTRSWRAPFDISGSRLMTRSPSRSRSNCRRCEPCGAGNQGRGAHHTGWLSLPYPTLPVG
jgi:hypothetical protein